MGDISLWDRCIDDITRNKEIVNHYQTLLQGVSSKRTIVEAESERDELKKLLKTICHDIEILQSTRHTQSQEMCNARAELNALREEQCKISPNIQKQMHLKEIKQTLFSKKVLLGMTIDDLREKYREAEVNIYPEIENLEKKKNTFQYNTIFEASKHSENHYEIFKEHHQREKRNAETRLNKLKEEITNDDNNVLLRIARENYKTLQQQYADLKNELDSINYDQIEEERQNLCKQEENLLVLIKVHTQSREATKELKGNIENQVDQSIYSEARLRRTRNLVEIERIQETE
ncbi:uncharacterized protein LOC144477650 [Augochlora pura]